jgi:hypothetical protein
VSYSSGVLFETDGTEYYSYILNLISRSVSTIKGLLYSLWQKQPNLWSNRLACGKPPFSGRFALCEYSNRLLHYRRDIYLELPSTVLGVLPKGVHSESFSMLYRLTGTVVYSVPQTPKPPQRVDKPMVRVKTSDYQPNAKELRVVCMDHEGFPEFPLDHHSHGLPHVLCMPQMADGNSYHLSLLSHRSGGLPNKIDNACILWG